MLWEAPLRLLPLCPAFAKKKVQAQHGTSNDESFSEFGVISRFRTCPFQVLGSQFYTRPLQLNVCRYRKLPSRLENKFYVTDMVLLPNIFIVCPTFQKWINNLSYTLILQNYHISEVESSFYCLKHIFFFQNYYFCGSTMVVDSYIHFTS